MMKIMYTKLQNYSLCYRQTKLYICGNLSCPNGMININKKIFLLLNLLVKFGNLR